MGKFNDGERNTGTLKESWMRDNIELAAGAAIVLGAANMASKGRFNQIGKHGKQGLGAIGKAGDKMLKKNPNRLTRTGYNITKQVARKLNNTQKPFVKPVTAQQMAQNQQRAKEVANSTDNLEDIGRITHERILGRVNKVNSEVAAGTRQGSFVTPNDFMKDVPEIQQGVRTQIFENVRDGKSAFAGMGSNADVAGKNLAGKASGVLKGEKVKKMDTFVSNGIAGLGLGAGVTAWNAGDRKLRGVNNDEEVDRELSMVGSFLPYKSKDERKREG